MRLLRNCRVVLLVWACHACIRAAAETDAWRAVFNRPEELARSRAPVVCVLNIQHPEVIQKQLADQLYSGKRFRTGCRNSLCAACTCTSPR